MGKKRGVWHPELVGLIRNYAPTQEAYDKQRENGRLQLAKNRAAGKCKGRIGIPDGWGYYGQEAAELRAEKHEEAIRIVELMIEQDLIPDDVAAQEALTYAVSVVRDGKTNGTRERLQAARMVLDFTKTKPASNANVTLNTAEDFLSKLADQASGR